MNKQEKRYISHREEFQIMYVAAPAFEVGHNSPLSEWQHVMTCLQKVEYGKGWEGKFTVEKPIKHFPPVNADITSDGCC